MRVRPKRSLERPRRAAPSPVGGCAESAREGFFPGARGRRRGPSPHAAGAEVGSRGGTESVAARWRSRLYTLPVSWRRVSPPARCPPHAARARPHVRAVRQALLHAAEAGLRI